MSFVRLPVLRHGLMARHPDILSDADAAARIAKTRALMSDKNVAVLLVYSDPTRNGPACWLTNYPCFGLGRRATVVLGREEGPFLFTAEPSRNLPRVRLMTTCDLEKTRQFLSAGCERARQIAGKGRIGLVGMGMANLPSGLVKETTGLEGAETECLSRAFSQLMAAKDESALTATARSLALAAEGTRLIAELAAPGRDLGDLAASVDHRLRLAGSEDTNILLGSSAGGRLRPGYPARIPLQSGDTLIAYLAVQYARLWGVSGSTFTIGVDGARPHAGMDALRAVQTELAAAIKPGMTLSAIEAVIRSICLQGGLPLADDVPVVTGAGFDLHEYPLIPEHKVGKDMVLQIALATDFAAGSTAMAVDMLHIRETGSVWLAGTHSIKGT